MRQEKGGERVPDQQRMDTAISVNVITDWIQKEVEIKQKKQLKRYVTITDQLCSDFSVHVLDEIPYTIWEAKNIEHISGTLSLSIQQNSHEAIFLWINDEQTAVIKRGSISLTLQKVYKIQLRKSHGTAYKGKFEFQYHYRIPIYNLDFSKPPTCKISKSDLHIQKVAAHSQKSQMVTPTNTLCSLQKVVVRIRGCADIGLKKKGGQPFIIKWPFEEIIVAWILASDQETIEWDIQAIDGDVYMIEDDSNDFTLYLAIHFCVSILSVKQSVITVFSSQSFPR